MKKQYESPVMEIVEFETEDIIQIQVICFQQIQQARCWNKKS